MDRIIRPSQLAHATSVLEWFIFYAKLTVGLAHTLSTCCVDHVHVAARNAYPD